MWPSGIQGDGYTANQTGFYVITIFLDRKKIIAVIDTTFAVVKRKPENKIRLGRDSNPMTSAISVQRSNQLS